MNIYGYPHDRWDNYRDFKAINLSLGLKHRCCRLIIYLWVLLEWFCFNAQICNSLYVLLAFELLLKDRPSYLKWYHHAKCTSHDLVNRKTLKVINLPLGLKHRCCRLMIYLWVLLELFCVNAQICNSLYVLLACEMLLKDRQSYLNDNITSSLPHMTLSTVRRFRESNAMLSFRQLSKASTT